MATTGFEITNDSSNRALSLVPQAPGAGYLLSIPVMMIWTIAGPAANGMMTATSERVGTRRTPRRNQQFACNRGDYRGGTFHFPVCVLHRQRAQLEPAGRTMVSRRRLAVLRDGNDDTCRTITGRGAHVEHHSAGADAKRKLCRLI